AASPSLTDKSFHRDRCRSQSYPVLIPVSRSYPRVKGRFLTCYSPVRRSSTPKGLSARLACVKHAASVRPEPGSNSPLNVLRNLGGPLQDAPGSQTEEMLHCARSDRASGAIW